MESFGLVQYAVWDSDFGIVDFTRLKDSIYSDCTYTVAWYWINLIEVDLDRNLVAIRPVHTNMAYMTRKRQARISPSGWFAVKQRRYNDDFFLVYI